MPNLSTNPTNKITLLHDTFLQKLLGQNYKWWYVIKFYIKTTATEFFVRIWVQLALIVQSLMILYVWHLGNFQVEVFTYLIVGRIYKALSDSYFFDILGQQIIGGQITADLMRPQDYIQLTFFRTIGYRIIDNLTSGLGMLLAGIVASLFFAQVELNSRLLLLLLFLPISFWIQHFTGFIFGCTAFFLEDKRAFQHIMRIYNTVFLVVFTGTFLPIDKIPFGFIIEKTPFAYFLHLPMQIYLGKYNNFQIFWVFLGGVSWCILLYFLARLVFKIGLKRNESVGL